MYRCNNISNEYNPYNKTTELWLIVLNRIKVWGVRFQVLTAASMMFRAVFWVVLPCKMIVWTRYEAIVNVKYAWTEWWEWQRRWLFCDADTSDTAW
jgi:hypothetical protein